MSQSMKTLPTEFQNKDQKGISTQPKHLLTKLEHLMKDTKSSAIRNSHNVTVPNPKKTQFDTTGERTEEDPLTLEGISGMVVIEQQSPYEQKLSATLQPNDNHEDLLVYDEDFDHINGDLHKGDSAVRSNEGGSSSPNSEPKDHINFENKAKFVT